MGIDVAIRQSGTVWTNNGPELDGRNNQTKRKKKDGSKQAKSRTKTILGGEGKRVREREERKRR